MIPIRDNILFKPLESDGVTEGGLIVPENCREVSNKGVVVLVGHGTPKNPMRLKVGDVGFRVKGWGDEVIYNGEKHYLMSQNAVIALQ